MFNDLTFENILGQCYATNLCNDSRRKYVHMYDYQRQVKSRLPEEGS